ncbi:unnamed protein product [Owenia fusiformis]|uniref:Protein phosphatase 1 regulatory subunit 12B n=1 Tax=Owenia fusiformis TaxID=6347 RepID=A0A8S4PZ50_OWEFU|nr:unnamed protein product [Owenia fusiformis]
MADGEKQKSALFRRHEQILRWKDSDTVNEPLKIRKPKVKFQDGCVFLAACSSGDTDEVKALLSRGADINTANVDGLTALHQACIDDNIAIVEFLVENGADINVCDNEGWTPLHATASCGFLDIAEYLIKGGCDLANVNSDGDLALDIADTQAMEECLEREMEKQGIDAESARNWEENRMLQDANSWLNSEEIIPHREPKSEATPLHVASAKGYLKVMDVLLKLGVDVDAKDADGWTPLHAAVHWGQEEACKVLVEHMADMEAKNNAGLSVFDEADTDMLKLLIELKKKQTTLKDKKDVIQTKVPPPLKRRTSITRMSVDQKQNVVIKNLEEEREQLERGLFKKEDRKTMSSSSSSEESSSDSETEKQNAINKKTTLTSNNHALDTNSSTTFQKATTETPKIEESSEISKPSSPKITDLATTKKEEIVKKKDDILELKKETDKDETEEITKDKEQEKISSPNPHRQPLHDSSQRDITLRDTLKDSSQGDIISKNDVKSQGDMTSKKAKDPISKTISDPGSFRNPQGVSALTNKTQLPRHESIGSGDGPGSWRAGLRKTPSSSAVPEGKAAKDELLEKLSRSASSPRLAGDQDRTSRRPYSTSDLRDPASKDRFLSYQNRFTTLTNSSSAVPPARQSSYVPLSRRRQLEAELKAAESESRVTTTPSINSTTTTTTSRGSRAYEPPKRDEEAETQRKARAKKARETRRSTQGVTKEDLALAQQTLQFADKSKIESTSKIEEENKSDKENKPDATTVTRRSKYLDDKKSTNEDDSRTSYRRSSRNNDRDTLSTDTNTTNTTSAYIPRSLRNSNLTATTTNSTTTSSTTSSTTTSIASKAEPTGTTTTTTPAYTRRYQRNHEEDIKEEEDTTPKSSAIRARRNRKERRPTGITYGDEETKDEKEKGKESEEEKKDTSSGSRYSSRYSSTDTPSTDRYASTTGRSASSDRPSSYAGYSRQPVTSTSEKDFKKLYEEEKSEHEKSKEELKATQRELRETKLELDRIRRGERMATESVSDRRERRQLERKLSEMEEEVKLMEQLKQDNQRLKEENGALIRVISKLSK